MSAQPMPEIVETPFTKIAHASVLPGVIVCAVFAAAILIVPPAYPLTVDELAAETGVAPIDAVEAPPASSEGPTPYSNAHARVQAQPGEPEEQPPTF